jgi:hypothetical protein
MRASFSAALAVALVAAYGCHPDAGSLLAPDDAAFAKGGNKDTETNPMAIWDFRPTHSGGTATLVQGDGATVVSPENEALVAEGTTGAYEGGLCGVRATIFWANSNYSGDGVFDPDIEPNKARCEWRHLELALPGGPVLDAPHSNVRAIMDVVDERVQPFQFNHLNNDQCDRVHYEAVLVTRLSGTPSTRGTPGNMSSWEVESVSQATCWVGTGKERQVGDAFDLPFRVVIHELPSEGSLERP